MSNEDYLIPGENIEDYERNTEWALYEAAKPGGMIVESALTPEEFEELFGPLWEKEDKDQ
jgi:hypothetical protein